jgi:glucosamine-6-phosphate deaminase
MEGGDEKENGIELIDFNNEEKTYEKKDKKESFSFNTLNQFLYIIIALNILYFFQKKWIYDKNNKYYFKFKNIDEINRNASETIVNLVNKKPNARIGLFYDESLLGIYNYLITKYENGEVSFKNVKFFSFDGLCGLKKDSNNSYFHFLNESFLSKIDAKEENLYLINEEGYNKCDFDDNLEVYNEIFEKISLDLQIILFDEDGNIGFNNLNTDFDAYAHIVKLTPKDRMKIKDLFGSLEKTPIYGVTLGIKNILQTKEIIAIGIGKDKAKVVRIITNGIFIKKYPITVLNKHSGKVTVYTDQEGGSLVKGFYKKF